MRRGLFIASIIVVLAGLATAAYFLFFTGSPGVTVAPAGSTSFPTADNAPTSGGAGSATSSAASAPTGAVKIAARLYEIDKGPVVAGALAFDIVATSTGTTTKDVAIEYLRRDSGNIFSYLLNAGTLTRLSNRTVPGIEKATWLPSGDTALVQYLSGTDNATINTYALPASGTGGSFLPQDIDDLSVGQGGAALYVASGANGSIATLVKFPSRASSQAFTTPLTQVRAQFAGKNYLAYTKPSATVGGFAFLVSGGAFTPLAGPLPGLTALAAPSGATALIAYTSGGVLRMELVDTKTRTATILPLATIADKCVWATDSSAVYCAIPQDPSPSYAYPDDWYQGAVHFSDQLWKFDITNHVATLVLDFSNQANAALDATDLSIDPAGKALLFRNKNDASLWVYAL